MSLSTAQPVLMQEAIITYFESNHKSFNEVIMPQSKQLDNIFNKRSLSKQRYGYRAIGKLKRVALP